MSDFDPDRIRQRLSELGEEWVDADAAATLLEETKKSVFADLALKATGQTVAAREVEALASPQFKEHLEKMVEARRQANRLKVKYETGKMWAEMKRSQESTRREEMRMR